MGCSRLDWDADCENYVRQCNELASEELSDDMGVAVAVAQDKATILRCAKRRAIPAWGIPAEAPTQTDSVTLRLLTLPWTNT